MNKFEKWGCFRWYPTNLMLWVLWNKAKNGEKIPIFCWHLPNHDGATIFWKKMEIQSIYYILNAYQLLRNLILINKNNIIYKNWKSPKNWQYFLDICHRIYSLQFYVANGKVFYWNFHMKTIFFPIRFDGPFSSRSMGSKSVVFMTGDY